MHGVRGILDARVGLLANLDTVGRVGLIATLEQILGEEQYFIYYKLLHIV